MSKKISITGAGGMLGSDLAVVLKKNGFDVLALDLPEFDITRVDHLERAFTDADVVVNCAAYTQVDAAEDNPDLAAAVNALAVGNLGEIAAARNVHVVHVSTDFVFNGKGEKPYDETDQPDPLGVYGKTKLEGERLLKASGCRHAIMRVEWSYGRHGVNFVTKLMERARTGADLKVVDDQVGAPTWTQEMAMAIKCIISGDHTGLFHFANDGYASRFEAACFILRKAGLSNKIAPCTSAEFPMKAGRPANSRFNTAKIKAILDFEIRTWQEALSAFLA